MHLFFNYISILTYFVTFKIELEHFPNSQKWKTFLHPSFYSLFWPLHCLVNHLKKNKYTFRSFLLINSLDYSIDKNSAVGFFVGQVSGKVNENNIEKLEQTFYGSVYVYAFECYFCDTFLVVSGIGTGSTDYETKDGSIYSYSGWGIQIYGGYQWYFENNVSFVIGLGPSYLDSGKKSESLKSTADYDKDVEDYVKNRSFQPINSIPLLLVGYTF